MDMELDTVQWTGNQCRIAGTFLWRILLEQENDLFCPLDWIANIWHSFVWEIGQYLIQLGIKAQIYISPSDNLKYNFLILWKTPTLFSRHYITIFLLFFYLVATNSICLAVDSLCILYTQPSYPTPHIIICYIISWSRVNFRLTYFWSIGSWCDGSDGACIGQFCAPEAETFLFHLKDSISNLSFLFCAQNVAKIEGLSVEYWTSLWAGLSQIYLHFKLKMASLWQVVMFEPVPSQECSLSMLW